MSILKKIKANMSVTFFLALLVASNGCFIIYPVLFKAINSTSGTAGVSNTWQEALSFLELLDIPSVIIGLILILMSFGLAFRIRLIWFFSIVLLCAIALIDVILSKSLSIQLVYYIITIAALLLFWRQFGHHSVGGVTFFAIVSITTLILYSMLGTLYAGDQYSPPITDLSTAFYYAIVCMSTVGFGDIVPHTTEARMFTLTIITFGITVFATSLGSLAGPIISNNMNRLTKKRIADMNRANHYIIVGINSLATNVYKSLREQGNEVTVVCKSKEGSDLPDDADIIEGDQSSVATLRLAGADKAKYVMALSNSDAENTFVVLAAKEIASEKTKVIALVNESNNLVKVKRVSPDMIFSLSLLGSEMLVRTLNGEKIDNDFIMEMFLGGINNHH